MLMADGGGGSAYGGLTHRELNAYVGSASWYDLDTLRRTWRESGLNAHQMADLIEQKLADLTAEGGWTGSGAEAYVATVTHDLVANLRAYALRAGGYAPQGEQRVNHAADLEKIQDAVLDSYGVATNNNIPWDVDTNWEVARKEVEQSLFGKIDEAVTGEDEAYEAAKSNAPYEIRNGGDTVLREVPKTNYEAVADSVPDNPAAPVFEKTDTQVSSQVKRFDRVMEGLGMDAQPRANVYDTVTSVDSRLSDYTPAPVAKVETTDTKDPGGTSTTPGGGTGSTPGTGTTPGTTPGGGTGTTPGTGTNPGTGTSPGTGTTPDIDLTPPSGVNPPGTGGGGGTFPIPIDPTDPTGPPVTTGPIDGGPITGGVGDDGTGAAGAEPGGIGSPTLGTAGGPGGPVNVGATSGTGGLGNLGSGVLNPGAAGTSFSIGADGRPQVNSGSVGGLPGRDGAGARGLGANLAESGRGGAGSGGPGGSSGSGGSGAGAAGPAGGPIAGGRNQRRDGDSDEESEEQVGDEVWLEEDTSVWGARAAAPPSEIR